MGCEGDLRRGVGILRPLLRCQFHRSHVDHACKLRIAELGGNPRQMLRLLGVNSEDGSSAFVLTGSVANTTLKANPNRLQAACLHALTEGFCDAPSVIGHKHRAAWIERRRNARAAFDFDLPTPCSLMSR